MGKQYNYLLYTFSLLSRSQASEHNSIKESNDDLKSSKDEEADSSNKKETSYVPGTTYWVSEEHVGAKVKTVGEFIGEETAVGQCVEKTGSQIHHTLLPTQIVSVLSVMGLKNWINFFYIRMFFVAKTL